MVEVGFSKNCAQRIREVSYSAKKSRFVLRDDEFEIPMIGEFNVRNAAMAISARNFMVCPRIRFARHYRSLKEWRDARKSAAKSEGESDDDFGHHPTAIAQTLTRYVVVIQSIGCGPFSSRAPTPPPRCFSARVAESAENSRRRFHFQVARLEQIPEAERLNPEAVVNEINRSGRSAFMKRTQTPLSSGSCRC